MVLDSKEAKHAWTPISRMNGMTGSHPMSRRRCHRHHHRKNRRGWCNSYNLKTLHCRVFKLCNNIPHILSETFVFA